MPVDSSSRTTLTTATSMRVLAHPTRLRLLGLLRERGPQTAAQLGDVVDEAPGTISYHLSKLAAAALIELADAQSTDHRERWWQATSSLTSWEPDESLDDPEKLSASSALQKSIAQINAARFSEHVDAMPALPREWVAAGTSGDRTLYLTVEELGQLRSELEELADRWLGTSAAHATGGNEHDLDATKPVIFVYQAFRRP
jgi:DNA-binding transcriptional ArsR family regulator